MIFNFLFFFLMSYSNFKLASSLLYHIKICFFHFQLEAKLVWVPMKIYTVISGGRFFFTLTHDFFQSLKYLPTVSSSLTPLSEAVGKPQHKQKRFCMFNNHLPGIRRHTIFMMGLWEQPRHSNTKVHTHRRCKIPLYLLH